MRSILLFLLGLSACQPVPQMQDPLIVKVPVMAPCPGTEVPEPDWNVVRLGINAPPTAELQAVLADLDLSKGYIEELKAELEACA